MEMELELEDLPPKALRKMVRALLTRGSKPSDEEKEDEDEKADKERQDLADLHAEGSGSPPEIPVLDDDLPEGVAKKEKKKGTKKGK